MLLQTTPSRLHVRAIDAFSTLRLYTNVE